MSQRAPRPRKVAVVCHYFPHYRTATLRRLAASKQNEYWFLAATWDPQRQGVKGSPIEQHSRFRSLWTWRLGSLFFQPGLLGWALGRQVDTLVIAAVPHCLSYWIAPWLARLRGKRVIFWTIGWIQDERGPKNLLRVAFYSLANSLLMYGHYGKVLAMQRGFRPERMHVVYNALDYETQSRHRSAVTPEMIQETRRSLFPDPETPILVCCSRLQPHRQLGLVIAAMARLREQSVCPNLLLVGDGPEKERLQQQAAEAGVPVHFYGACYDEAILSRLIMSCDLTVAPGMVGLTAMQSLAYGTPVLTHDDPYQQAPESDALEPGLTGQFFRYQDVDDLARKIREWFAQRPDRDLVRQSCLRMIERFYNPEYQARVIERAVAGEPANDLFWMYETETGGSALPGPDVESATHLDRQGEVTG